MTPSLIPETKKLINEGPFLASDLLKLFSSYIFFSYIYIYIYSSVAFSLDTEQPDYDLDSDDDMFVNKLKKKMEISQLQFEEMIDRLEKGSGQQVGSLWLFTCKINLQTHQTIDHQFLTVSLRYWKLNLAGFPFYWCWSFISEVSWLYLTRVPCVLAGEPPRGQTAAKGGRWAHQGGFWLLEPQEEKQQGQLAHPHRQAGEAGWLQHQRPLRGLPTSHWENANQKGLWMLLFFFLSVFVSL